MGYLLGNVFAQLEGAHFTPQIGFINGLFGYVIGALLATIVFEILSGVYGYCFGFNFDLIAGLTTTAVAVSIILGFLNGTIGFICNVLIATAVATAAAATVEYKLEGVLTCCETTIIFIEYGTVVPLAPVDIVLKCVKREREGLECGVPRKGSINNTRNLCERSNLNILKN